jgi:hypothetical protein
MGLRHVSSRSGLFIKRGLLYLINSSGGMPTLARNDNKTACFESALVQIVHQHQVALPAVHLAVKNGGAIRRDRESVEQGLVKGADQ